MVAPHHQASTAAALRSLTVHVPQSYGVISMAREQKMLSAQQHQPLQAAGSHLLPVAALLPREQVRDAREVSLKRQGERAERGLLDSLPEALN